MTDFANSLGNLDVTKSGATVSKADPGSIPGFAPSSKNGWDPSKFIVKYKRINCTSDDDIQTLEEIETRAIRGEGVYVLSKERFLFMDQILILVNYLEKIDEE